jgi:hypothetical protein
MQAPTLETGLRRCDGVRHPGERRCLDKTPEARNDHDDGKVVKTALREQLRSGEQPG